MAFGAILLIAVVMQGGCNASQSSSMAPKELKGSSGEVVVMVFTSVDCPIANAMAPQLRRTLEMADSGGARCLLVYPRQSTTDAERAQHQSDYRLPGISLSDGDHRLVDLLDAKITPEAFVVVLNDDQAWDVVYRGRVNDLYSSIGNRRDQPSRHDLHSAIEAALAGKIPETSRTEAVGCLIER
jgi:hypothetical protein